MANIGKTADTDVKNKSTEIPPDEPPLAANTSTENQEPTTPTTIITSPTKSTTKPTSIPNNSKAIQITTPKKFTNLGQPTSQKPSNSSRTTTPSKSDSNPKTSTAAVACNKTTSLLSESQKFTTLMVFFGLPIGLLLVLVGTLSVALLLVTRKRMKLRKGAYLSETTPFFERVKA